MAELSFFILKTEYQHMVLVIPTFPMEGKAAVRLILLLAFLALTFFAMNSCRPTFIFADCLPHSAVAKDGLCILADCPEAWKNQMQGNFKGAPCADPSQEDFCVCL
ncbi:hypothetical protein SLA2020_422140 [Shorea laevis]